MKVYTVHEPPEPPADRVDRAERFVFVSDGFDWQALALGPFALIGHRLWLGLAIYAAALAVVIALMRAIGSDEGWILLAFTALNVILAYEIGELRRARLDGRGWAMLGTVSGGSLPECERRFFENWMPRQPLIARHSSMAEAQAPDGGSQAGLAPVPQHTKSRRLWPFPVR